MKLMFFNEHRLGVVRGNEVVDVTGAIGELANLPPHDRINAVISAFENLRAPLEAAAKAGTGVKLADVKVRAPLPRPGNIVCMAVNYMEDGTRKEKAPINAFLKASNSVIGPGESMKLPDVPATVFEGEAEIAVVIGRTAKNISAENAMDYVFGFTNFIDGSARGLPPSGNVFFQMKSRATFAPLGPYIVTADEVADPHELQVKLWVNGDIKQDYNTNDMAHRIPRCLEWISAVHTLEPGDVVALGTNHRGLNAFQDGDVVELECQGLGRLKIGVEDPLKRTWSRETRLERSDKGLDPVAPQLSGKYLRQS